MERGTLTSGLIKGRQNTKKNVSCNGFALASNAVASLALDAIDDSLKHRVSEYDQVEPTSVNVDRANVTQIRLDDLRLNSLIAKTCDPTGQLELSGRQRRIAKEVEGTMLRVALQGGGVIATSAEGQSSS